MSDSSAYEPDHSGERISFGSTPWDLELDHLSRYQACRPLAAGRRVLDAACGTGYGAAALAAASRSTVGVDLDAGALREARLRYAGGNLRFVQASIGELPFSADSFDLFTSFETLEHVDGATQDAFLAETRRVLCPSGLLVISTPDRHVASDLTGLHNPFHVLELYEHEFRAKLARHYPHVVLYVQNLWLYAEIVPRDQAAPDARALMREPVTSGQNMIAVCSDQPLPDLTTLVRAPLGYRDLLRIHDEYCESLSWRLTQPLRSLRAFARRLGRSLRPSR